jgi:hypothetical protein
MQAHTLTFCIWFFFRIVETVDAHSGFRLPFSPWQIMDSVQVHAHRIAALRFHLRTYSSRVHYSSREVLNDTIFTIPTSQVATAHFSAFGTGCVEQMCPTGRTNLVR